jgi:hypothetical protein
VIQNIRNLGRREPEVNGDANCSDQGRGVVCFEKVVAIGVKNGDRTFMAYSRTDQKAREAIYAVEEFTIGPALTAADNRLLR